MELKLPSCMEGVKGDSFRVWTPVDDFVAEQGVLFFNITEEVGGVPYECGVHLDRDRIVQLRNALTDSLGDS